jgi:hypothetical protein
MKMDLHNTINNIGFTDDQISDHDTDLIGIDSIRFRCPHCQKLYFTLKSDFDLKFESLDSKLSEFECSNCEKSFALIYNHDDSGLFVTRPVKPIETVHCPKCAFIKNSKSDECPSCGVLETRYRDIEKLENPKLYQLNNLWKKVLIDFEDEKRHLDFINQAQSQQALNFASTKYSGLYELIGSSEQVNSYLEQINLRLKSQVEKKFYEQSAVAQNSEIENENWKIPFTSFHINLKTLSLLGAVTGTIILLINKIHPFFPYLTGIVFALTVLFYGLWMLSYTGKKRPQI